MSTPDWIIWALTLLTVVGYGIYKSRRKQQLEDFLVAGKSLPWYHVCLSLMATQASAITFLSAPGQSYTDGMRFIQFYFGLPLAMIVLSVTFVPVFHKLRVFTAYEFLEGRFDRKTRVLTALLFLLQRGVSTGISIYAPALIFSAVLDIPEIYTTLLVGILVIVYTTYGGSMAVSHTQLLQMTIVFFGLLLSGYLAYSLLPARLGLGGVMEMAGAMGRMKIIDPVFDWDNRYTLWSGIIGGFFLQLSYFGTDQSQVGRYLTGNSIRDSRMGLLLNGLIKIPMQFIILFIGILVFCFYQFHAAPLHFNPSADRAIRSSAHHDTYLSLEAEHRQLQHQKLLLIETSLQGDQKFDLSEKQKLGNLNEHIDSIRNSASSLIRESGLSPNKDDSNYIFLYFIRQHLPKGAIGLLIAMIFLASMGSLSAGLSSLASTTVVDLYQPKAETKNPRYLLYSRWSTIAWGFFCIACAAFAGRAGNLLEAVNILGSLFYGTILGIFVCAFYVKKPGANAVFFSALLTEALTIACWYYEWTSFLWMNVAACICLVVLALIFEVVGLGKKNPGTATGI